MPTTSVRVVVADRGDAGRRVDLVVRRHLSDLPRATRTRVQAWITSGRVLITGRLVTRVSEKVGLGDVVEVELPDDVVRAPLRPESGQLDCLFEDDHLLVVNKPPDMVSHPTYRHASGSLLNRVLAYADRWPAGERPSLVGRLDKLTSGAVLVAKTTAAHARLQRVLTSARSEKLYLAVVHGPVASRAGRIDLPLGRDPNDRRRVIVASAGGQHCATQFERLDQTEVAGAVVALLRCRLLTGRMHQVRVHLAAHDWPIVGDATYRPSTRIDGLDPGHPVAGFTRQALHACRVAFEHPFTGRWISVDAPVPPDLQVLLDATRLGCSPPAP